MKKVFVVLLSLTLLLCGCTPASSVPETPAEFYYCTYPIVYNDPKGLISCEVRDIASCRDDLLSLLNFYLKGPSGTQHASPFPNGVNALSVQTDSQTAQVLLSNQFARLSGNDLTVACACLSLTLCSLLDVDRVSVSTEGGFLDGKNSITIAKEDLILWDRALNNE